MWLKPRKTYLQDSRLVGSLYGQTIKVNIDRTWPIEEILVYVTFTTGATAPTITGADGALQLLKRATLSINDGIQPRNVVDVSGMFLVEYALQIGGNDRQTYELQRVGYAGTALAVSTTYRACYRIPMVHPSIYGPLRTQMLLPVHLHPQDPVLSLEFVASATLQSANAATFNGVEVVLLRREITPAVNDAIGGVNGFIPFDLIESSQTFPLSASEQRVEVPTPGQYAGLMLRHYKGGASISRANLGDEATPMSEARFRLESGGVVISDWKNHQIKSINEFSQRFDNDHPTAGSGTKFPGQVYLDFLTDGFVDADELGSLLDCNLPAQSGLKMQVIFSTVTVATNASTLNFGGHRYFGDLSRWQAKK